MHVTSSSMRAGKYIQPTRPCPGGEPKSCLPTYRCRVAGNFVHGRAIKNEKCLVGSLFENALDVLPGELEMASSQHETSTGTSTGHGSRFRKQNHQVGRACAVLSSVADTFAVDDRQFKRLLARVPRRIIRRQVE